MSTENPALRRARRCEASRKRYLEQRDEAILEASVAGESLRAIGAAVDLTPEGVRLVVRRERERLAEVESVASVA